MSEPRFSQVELSAVMMEESCDEPLAMRHLSESQKDELGVLLERYLESLESGMPPTVDSLTRNSPELREALSACVEGLESLHQMAGGSEPAVDLADDSDAEHRLGDFDLHEEIGRGGMGVVYRATQRSLNRTVAVKILPLASVLDPRQLTRFHHEAEAAASLQHPNIVPVFAIGCERGVHFYAMQRISGPSISEWIEDRALTDWREATAIAVAVADGLHAAHEYGVVHRDVKPSNLLLDEAGKVWISDFGLARIQSDVALTQSGDVVGTMRYMSPEQARGESAIVDGRSDVYSLAATLYEMLTLHPAHEGEDAATILRAIDEDAIKPLRRWRTDLPRDLETVVAKAMSAKRDDRYETSLQFANDLRRVLDGEPTQARPASIVDRTVRIAAKHRNVVMATGLVGLLSVIGFAIGTAKLAAGTAKLAASKTISDAHAAQSLQNELIARNVIDRLGNQVAQSLSGIPAANAVRHQLLQVTLDYYQKFSDAPSLNGYTDRRRSEDLAITFGKMGVLQSEIGDRSSAIESLEKSELHFKELVSEFGDDQSLQLSWAISQNNLADELAKSGNFVDASKWFTLAVMAEKRLHQAGNAEATVELAKTLNNLGSMLASTDNLNEAKVSYTQAIEMLAGLETQLDLRSTVQSNLAGMLADTDPIGAMKLARDSLTQQLSRLKLDSGNPVLATQVVLTLNTLAKAQSQSNDHVAAVKTLRQAVDVGRQLHTRWPEQLPYRRDLVISLNALGMSLCELGRLDQASTTLAHAAKHGRHLQAKLADNAEVLSMLGGVLNNLGFVKQQLGEQANAVECYQEAVRHQQTAANLSPDAQRYQLLLQKHQLNLNRVGGET